MGSGEGTGIEAPMAALADLNGLSGDSLPIGVYRCIGASSGSAYWEHLMIDADGAIGFADDEAVEDDVGPPAESLSLSVRIPHHV